MSNTLDRRNFLRTLSTAGAALTVAGTGRALAATSTEPSLTTDTAIAALGNRPGLSPMRYALSLGAAAPGWLKSAEGGFANASVIEERPGPDRIVRKHLANVKYDDLVWQGGAGLPRSVFDWIASTLAYQQNRQDGSVTGVNSDYQIASLVEFYGARLSEIGFPAFDAANPAPALLSLRCTPERTRVYRTRNLPSQRPALPSITKAKTWISSNFRLRIDGLDSACAFVQRIESMVVKQPVQPNDAGEFRDYEQITQPLQIPNLVVTLPEHRADAFYDWYDDFVIKGNCGQDAERSGTLELLTPSLREVLFTLTFNQLGIFHMSRVNSATGLSLLKVEMYCESMGFAASAAVGA